MTERERSLVKVLLGILLLGAVVPLVNGVFLGPMRTADRQVADKETAGQARETEIRAERDYIAKIQELSPRLGEWKKLSLPEGDPSPEAFKNHLAQVQFQYQKQLEDLLTRARFKV